MIIAVAAALCACSPKTQPAPTASPTEVPAQPTEAPTEVPAEPTAVPTEAPTEAPAEEKPAEEAPAEVPAEEKTAEETPADEPEADASKSSDDIDVQAVFDDLKTRGENIFDSYAFSLLNTAGKKVWTAPLVGIDEFQVPESFLNAKGGIRASGGLEEGKGIVTLQVIYITSTEEDYNKYVSDMSAIIEDLNSSGATDEKKQQYFDLLDEHSSKVTTLFTVVGIPNGTTEAEDKAAFQKFLDDNAEWYDLSEEEWKDYFDHMVFIPAGNAEEYNFYLVQGNMPDDNNIENADEEYKTEYKALYDSIADYVPLFKFSKPIGLEEVIESGTGLSFETTDIYGNPVKSSDLFSGHKVTMFNIWETTCGACISEFPNLLLLNQEIEPKGAQIVGLVYDATSEDLIAEAKDIVDDLGITYTIIVPTDELIEFFKVQAFPTTYFVNEKGEIAGEPVSGANFKLYRQQIENLLGE